MAENDDNSPENTDEDPVKVAETPPANQEAAKSAGKDTDLDLDEDLAEAMGEAEASTSLDAGEVDIDSVIAEEDPEFAAALGNINPDDFAGVVIHSGTEAEEVSEDAKVPSPFRTYIKNLPKDVKNRYVIATGVLAILLPTALLIYMGYLLPRFELPYQLSMNEYSQKVHSYDVTDPKVPLFDEFRTKAVTYALPKTMINLKADGNSPVYGEFEFFLNLRDKDMEVMIKDRESEIMDLIQRVLEQVSARELRSPLGKEKVKKVIRHQVNEYLNANIVLGVFYRSVLLNR